jgi:hypothetical protein
MLANAGKTAGPVGFDHHRIGDDHLDQVAGLLTATTCQSSYPLNYGEREPVRHLHRVLVLRGNSPAAEDGDYNRNDHNYREWNSRHRSLLRLRCKSNFSRVRSNGDGAMGSTICCLKLPPLESSILGSPVISPYTVTISHAALSQSRGGGVKMREGCFELKIGLASQRRARRAVRRGAIIAAAEYRRTVLAALSR